jgi:hydroxymethylglutaryl-CoA lyase
VAPDPYPRWVEVREVGPRDGLQNEDPIPVHERVRLIDALSQTGLRVIEVGSFVSARAVPSMAGTDQVLAGITRTPGVRYRVLVPNLRGAEAAITAGADEIEVVLSVSDTHNRKNLRMGTDESIDQIGAIVARAAEASVPVEAILATSFGCPYTGPVPAARVAGVAAQLQQLGVDTFSFADTTGMAGPHDVTALLDALEPRGLPPAVVALHFHNTRNTGMANLVVAAQHGVRRFDASIGGLGGCPFAPGATGNVPTEDVVHLLDALGATTGIDLDALIAVALELEAVLGRPLPGQIMRAGPRHRLAPQGSISG